MKNKKLVLEMIQKDIEVFRYLVDKGEDNLIFSDHNFQLSSIKFAFDNNLTPSIASIMILDSINGVEELSG